MNSDDMDRRWGDLVVWGPFTSITDADLDDVEQAIGVSLPDDYRRFMKVAHGGRLEYAVRLPPHDPAGSLIEFADLFTAVGDRAGTLFGEWQSHPSTFMAEVLPAPLLPVARDGGGSMLYLDMRHQTHGHVWAYVHGLPDWAGGDGRDRGGRIASSWQEYLAMLFIDEDLAQDIWEDARRGAEPDGLASVRRWLDAGLPGWQSRAWASHH
jgi:cell wall assembly regulator SMI1